MIQQVAFDIPKEIALGLASGEHVQYSGVVRDAANHIPRRRIRRASSNAVTYSFASTALAFQIARGNQLAYEIEVARDTYFRRFDAPKEHVRFIFAIELLVERFESFAQMPQQKRLRSRYAVNDGPGMTSDSSHRGSFCFY